MWVISYHSTSKRCMHNIAYARRPLGEAVLALVLGQAGRVLAHDAPGRAAWAHSGALATVQRAAEAAPPGSELAEAIQARMLQLSCLVNGLGLSDAEACSSAATGACALLVPSVQYPSTVAGVTSSHSCAEHEPADYLPDKEICMHCFKPRAAISRSTASWGYQDYALHAGHQQQLPRGDCAVLQPCIPADAPAAPGCHGRVLAGGRCRTLACPCCTACGGTLMSNMCSAV